MPHSHSIYDTDKHFLIDPSTRSITALSDKLTLIQYDHNCERYTFEIPRIIEGHDMSDCDSVEIHFDNISKDRKTTNHDFYTVVDLKVSEEDSSIVIFSWLISEAATQLVGKLRFSIHFECFNDDGTRTYGLNTAYFDKVTIDNGVSNTDNLIVEHSDFVSRMELLAEQNKETIEGFAENYEQNVHYEETVKEVKDILTPLNDTLQYMTYRKKTLIAETDSDNVFSYNDDYSSICFSVPKNFLDDLFDDESYSNDLFKKGLDFEIDIIFNLSGGTPYSGRAEQRVKLKPITFGFDGSNTIRYSTCGFSGIIQFTKHIELISGIYEMEDGNEKTSLLNKLISPIPVHVFTTSIDDKDILHISFEDANIYEVIRDNRYRDMDSYPSTIQIYKIEYCTPSELSDALDLINGEVV